MKLNNTQTKKFMNNCTTDGTIKVKLDKDRKVMKFIRKVQNDKEWGWAKTGFFPSNKAL
jgi:hypothetical protein